MFVFLIISIHKSPLFLGRVACTLTVCRSGSGMIARFYCSCILECLGFGFWIIFWWILLLLFVLFLGVLFCVCVVVYIFVLVFFQTCSFWNAKSANSVHKQREHLDPFNTWDTGAYQKLRWKILIIPYCGEATHTTVQMGIYGFGDLFLCFTIQHVWTNPRSIFVKVFLNCMVGGKLNTAISWIRLVYSFVRQGRG